MKKLFIAGLVALLGIAFTIPASALETKFGGYWRTRAASYNNFTGEDKTDTLDLQRVDTRTRIYFTAILNDNLKLVNKFEFNTKWGDTNGGDYGADGTKNFRIKNSYADFNVGQVNAKVGIQPVTIARGFIFDDDASGAVITYKGDGFSVPFAWLKAYEGGQGHDANKGDVDDFVISPTFKVGGVSINPVFMYTESSNISAWSSSSANFAVGGNAANFANLTGTPDDLDLYYFGVNVDANLGMASVWFTGIYETGTMDQNGASDIDVSGYLVAAGASADVGPVSIHGQSFYATGDDDANDHDFDAFFVPAQNIWVGQSYYWAEIMGYGMFDDVDLNGSPNDDISNIFAINAGVTLKPMDKLTLKGDLWYAQLAEDNPAGDRQLGTEIDLAASYQLIENLKLDIVGAYLFADDAVNYDAATKKVSKNDADPYELGARLSLSF